MRAEKPKKPYPDFPLTPHPAGVWVKKIKNKIHRFGGWANPEAALAKYLEQKDYLFAGLTPPDHSDTGKLTIDGLMARFLDAKDSQVQVGRISIRTLAEHRKSCERLRKIIGKNTVVESIRQSDFDQYAVKLAKGVSLVTFGNRIRLALVLFRFASDKDLIAKPLKFGDNFKLPSKSSLRAERQRKPTKHFVADEIRVIVEAATPIMKAMTLLGINCAFGPIDCAMLTMSRLDLESGWVDFPRPKTAVERRCPLWPETIDAIKAAHKARPSPSDPGYEDFLFLTITGRPYVRIDADGNVKDVVGANFGVLLKKLSLNGNFRAFYSLRRTFETIASAARDQIPVDHIMGHSPASDDMAAIYRQHIDDDRLKAVSDHVRSWLWPKVEQKV